MKQKFALLLAVLLLLSSMPFAVYADDTTPNNPADVGDPAPPQATAIQINAAVAPFAAQLAAQPIAGTYAIPISPVALGITATDAELTAQLLALGSKLSTLRLLTNLADDAAFKALFSSYSFALNDAVTPTAVLLNLVPAIVTEPTPFNVSFGLWAGENNQTGTGAYSAFSGTLATIPGTIVGFTGTTPTTANVTQNASTIYPLQSILFAVIAGESTTSLLEKAQTFGLNASSSIQGLTAEIANQGNNPVLVLTATADLPAGNYTVTLAGTKKYAGQGLPAAQLNIPVTVAAAKAPVQTPTVPSAPPTPAPTVPTTPPAAPAAPVPTPPVPTLPTTITANNRITGIRSDAWLGNLLTKNDKPLAAGDSLDDLDIAAGDYITLHLNSDFFDWKDPAPSSPVPVTASMLRSGKIAVGVSASRNRNVIDHVEIDSRSNQAFIRIKFVDSFASITDKDFSMTVFLTHDKRRNTDSQLTLNGTIRNPIIELDGDEDYVDLSEGDIAHANGYIRNIEVYLGNNVSMYTRMFSGKKYYGTASDTITSSDEAMLLKYPAIERIFTLTTLNLKTSGRQVAFDLDDRYYVYDENGRYIGTTADRLTYSSRYYLTSRKINMEESTSRVDDEDDDDATDAATPPPATIIKVPVDNGNHNPPTGGPQ